MEFSRSNASGSPAAYIDETLAKFRKRAEKLRSEITEEKVKLGTNLRETAQKDNLYDTILEEPKSTVSTVNAPTVEIGTYGTELEAYKAAYEEKFKLEQKAIAYIQTVSYTHLTLPTKA